MSRLRAGTASLKVLKWLGFWSLTLNTWNLMSLLLGPPTCQPYHGGVWTPPILWPLKVRRSGPRRQLQISWLDLSPLEAFEPERWCAWQLWEAEGVCNCVDGRRPHKSASPQDSLVAPPGTAESPWCEGHFHMFKAFPSCPSLEVCV